MACVVQWIAAEPVGLVIVGPAPRPVQKAAASARVPLLRVPRDARLPQMAQAVRLLLTRRALQLAQRGAQIYRWLSQLSAENRGLDVLLAAMAELSGHAVVLQDKRLSVVGRVISEEGQALWPAVEEVLLAPAQLPAFLRDRRQLNEAVSPLYQTLPVQGLARYVMPVVVQQLGRGFVSVLGRAGALDALDALVAEHGAGACALEMAKAKAVREAEKRWQGDFFEDLVADRLTEQEASDRAERLELDAAAPRVGLVMAWRGEAHPSSRRLESLVNGVLAASRAAAHVWRRGDEVVALLAVKAVDPIDQAFDLARALRAQARRQSPEAALAIGIGRPVSEILDWPASYRDARQAALVAARLALGRPLFFGDLGIYRLLARLEGDGELRAFCQELLGPLIAYDQAHDGPLIETLEAFFACHGNLSQAARRLHVHRNTLLYRLERIAALSIVDLDNEESRLATHLALKVRRLLCTET
jgi:purine catabolism regulator